MTTIATRLEPFTRRLERAIHRVQQFLASLWPRISPAEQAELGRWLPPQAVALFCRMTARDQRHSLNVLRRTQHVTPTAPDLAAAALLHDAAKTAQTSRRVRLHHRVLVVLMEAVRPGWVQQIARDEPDSWRYPFYLHLAHSRLSAELAAQAGCSALTVELIRRHQDKLIRAPADETERLLAVLQAADDAS